MSYSFHVAGELRSCPEELWLSLEGPRPSASWRECDGCTASPDSWRGIALWPACRIHDWHCQSGEVGRLEADLILARNLWRCLRFGGAPWWRAIGVAALYGLGVRVGARLGIGVR